MTRIATENDCAPGVADVWRLTLSTRKVPITWLIAYGTAAATGSIGRRMYQTSLRAERETSINETLEVRDCQAECLGGQ